MLFWFELKLKVKMFLTALQSRAQCGDELHILIPPSLPAARRAAASQPHASMLTPPHLPALEVKPCETVLKKCVSVVNMASCQLVFDVLRALCRQSMNADVCSLVLPRPPSVLFASPFRLDDSTSAHAADPPLHHHLFSIVVHLFDDRCWLIVSDSVLVSFFSFFLTPVSRYRPIALSRVCTCSRLVRICNWPPSPSGPNCGVIRGRRLSGMLFP